MDILVDLSSRILDNGDFKWEAWILDQCGIDYYEYSFRPELLTMKVLESRLDEIVDRIETLKKTVDERPYRGRGLFSEPVYDEFIYSLDQVAVVYQILALLILETGSFLPEKVKQEVLRTTTWEYDEKREWSPNIISARKLFLKKFREALKNHVPGRRIDTDFEFG